MKALRVWELWPMPFFLPVSRADYFSLTGASASLPRTMLGVSPPRSGGISCLLLIIAFIALTVIVGFPAGPSHAYFS